MKLATSDEVGPELIKLLGLPCGLYRKVVITIEGGKLLRVDTEQEVGDFTIDGPALETVFDQYELRRKE